MAMAVEDPAPSLTDAQGVNQSPDFVARLKWSPPNLPGIAPRVEHVQTAILVRQLRGEVNNDPGHVVATGGFGINVSGVLVPRWDQDDRIRFATNNGYGVGRYITDLGSLGGQDAVYDVERNELRSLPVASAYFGYERKWRPGLLSTVTYGVVNVSTLDIQPGSALSSTQRGTINLTWSPFSRVDLVAEFLAGSRRNKDGQKGRASQIQLGSTFRF
jgi:hypothetical protein